MSLEVEFDMEKLRLNADSPPLAAQIKKCAPKRQKYLLMAPGEMFLQGPISWPWLTRASAAPGKALHVAVAICFYAYLNKSLTISLNLSRLAELGITRDSARRGLGALEKSKLVAVVRHTGRKPIVTILLIKQKGKRVRKKFGKSNWNRKESGMKGGTK